jgi:hypothetical protein
MGNEDQPFVKKLAASRLRPVPASEVPVQAPGEGRIQITIDGVGPSDAELIKLLEDTAKFIKDAGGRVGAEAFTEKGMAFQRLDLSDVVSLKHRS